MIRARRLNAKGIEAFEQALERLVESHAIDGELLALDDPMLSEPHPLGILVDDARSFGTRFELCEYLHQLFESTGTADPLADVGLWAWLSVVWFSQLCPPKSDGTVVPGAVARYVPSADYKRSYRHLLLGPYRIFRSHGSHPELALAALCGPLDKPGELGEQLGARVEIAATPSIVGAATLLYVDPASKRPKRGAGGSSKGTPRRFGTVIRQLDVTWDLAGMTPEEIVFRLPREFDRFKPVAE